MQQAKQIWLQLTGSQCCCINSNRVSALPASSAAAAWPWSLWGKIQDGETGLHTPGAAFSKRLVRFSSGHKRCRCAAARWTCRFWSQQPSGGGGDASGASVFVFRRGKLASVCLSPSFLGMMTVGRMFPAPSGKERNGRSSHAPVYESAPAPKWKCTEVLQLRFGRANERMWRSDVWVAVWLPLLQHEFPFSFFFFFFFGAHSSRQRKSSPKVFFILSFLWLFPILWVCYKTEFYSSAAVLIDCSCLLPHHVTSRGPAA